MKDRTIHIRFLILGIILSVLFALLCGRLIQWQLVEGEKFLEESESSTSFYTVTQAARGEILDTNGNELVSNRTVYNIVFNAMEMPREQRNETIYQLILLMEQCGEDWVDILPITTDDSGAYIFKENQESEIEYMKSASMLRLNSYATAEDCMNTMISEDDYDIDTKEIPKDYILKVASVRYNMTRSDFSVRYPYTFAEDISIATVTVISEYLSELPGVSVQVSTAREYNATTLAPHIIGYTGALSSSDYETLKEEGKTATTENYAGYTYNDKIGQAGIEQAMEEELRGTNGRTVVATNANGELVDSTEESVDPIPGNTVYLTLESNLQAVANASLAQNVAAAAEAGKEKQATAVANGSDKLTGYGEDCVSGAAVVLRVSDFGVLAMSTYPSYDLEASLNDSTLYSQLLEDETTPLLNRATMGTYQPGSVFKPSVALAALQEGVITTDTLIHCSGVYYNDDFADYHPECMGVHGDITVSTALQKSCNIFFYETSYRLGIQTMNLYCNLFGLGTKTGIELYEREGILAGPDEFENYHPGEQWTDGITVQAGIGQSDNSFTPLQLATYVATIANDGVRLRTHLVEKVTDYTRQTVLSVTETQVMADAGLNQEYVEAVQYGMYLVTQEGGTASGFATYDPPIAAKTGTAELGGTGGKSDNAVFIAYAPYDDPEIAVAVVLERGSSGVYAQNVARDIFDAYFHGKTVDEQGNIVMTETAD